MRRTGATSTPSDASLVTSDITTNDASTSKHGFRKKLTNVAYSFMDEIGTIRANIPHIVASSGTASATTNAASETNLVAITLPVLGANDRVEVRVLVKCTGTAGTKTLTVRHSTVSGDATGTLMFTAATTAATLSAEMCRSFWNANSQSSQIMQPNTGSTLVTVYYQLIATAPLTGSINTAVASYINLNGQTANAGDTMSIVGYTVTVYPGV